MSKLKIGNKFLFIDLTHNHSLAFFREDKRITQKEWYDIATELDKEKAIQLKEFFELKLLEEVKDHIENFKCLPHINHEFVIGNEDKNEYQDSFKLVRYITNEELFIVFKSINTRNV